MKQLIHFLKAFLTILFSVFILQAFPQIKKPSSETVKEINKVLDDIKKLKNDGKADDDPKIKELAKKAIFMADTAFNITQKNWDGEPEYNPDLSGDGLTSLSGKKGKSKVTLGPDAFSSTGWLASTKYHESIHGGRIAGGAWPQADRSKVAKTRNILEAEAYDGEIENAKKIFDLSEDDIKKLKERRKGYYDGLDAANKKKVDKKDYTVAFLGPSDKSKRFLASANEIFVTGKVLSNERMKVSVRGPNIVAGNVVTAEVNGNTVKTQTDKDGNAMLDFAAITAGMGLTAVAIIKTFDEKGNVLDQKETAIQNGTPMIFDRPVYENLPANLQNNSIVTIPGNNIGADANLVIGNQVQETLSASNQELTTFIDCTTGSQPAFIITPNGVSESQNINIYNLNFSIPKTQISPKEKINGKISYEGLPIGTELVITNHTPSAITINVPSGQKMADKTIYKITKNTGEIPVTITGITRGAFSIGCDPQFVNARPRTTKE